MLFKKFGYYNVVKFAPYLFKCKLLNIETFSGRRITACIILVFDILSQLIESQKILSVLNINVAFIGIIATTLL